MRERGGATPQIQETIADLLAIFDEKHIDIDTISPEVVIEYCHKIIQAGKSQKIMGKDASINDKALIHTGVCELMRIVDFLQGSSSGVGYIDDEQFKEYTTELMDLNLSVIKKLLPRCDKGETITNPQRVGRLLGELDPQDMISPGFISGTCYHFLLTYIACREERVFEAHSLATVRIRSQLYREYDRAEDYLFTISAVYASKISDQTPINDWTRDKVGEYLRMGKAITGQPQRVFTKRP